MNNRLFPVFAALALGVSFSSAQNLSPAQLEKWHKRFPEADADGDGKLTREEALAFYQKRRKAGGKGRAASAKVDPAWDGPDFPEHAAYRLGPAELAKAYGKPLPDHERPADGSLRIVGTGHSFMAPGYKTLPVVAKAAGLAQPPLWTHTGGGVTGSARYKWEQENGIFQFDGKATPKVLAAVANAEWDAMMWGPYFNDRPQYYTCWMDFALGHNPGMKFFLSDAWPQVDQMEKFPASDAEFAEAVVTRLGAAKNESTKRSTESIREQYPGKFFVMPTSDAMVLAVKRFSEGRLPGIQGVSEIFDGNKGKRCPWRDRLGHLDDGLGNLEGYVFYATLYRKSPTLLEGDPFRVNDESFPSRQLDVAFREIAWEAVTNNPLSGIVDKDGDGVGD